MVCRITTRSKTVLVQCGRCEMMCSMRIVKLALERRKKDKCAYAWLITLEPLQVAFCEIYGSRGKCIARMLLLMWLELFFHRFRAANDLSLFLNPSVIMRHCDSPLICESQCYEADKDKQGEQQAPFSQWIRDHYY